MASSQCLGELVCRPDGADMRCACETNLWYLLIVVILIVLLMWATAAMRSR